MPVPNCQLRVVTPVAAKGKTSGTIFPKCELDFVASWDRSISKSLLRKPYHSIRFNTKKDLPSVIYLRSVLYSSTKWFHSMAWRWSWQHFLRTPFQVFLQLKKIVSQTSRSTFLLENEEKVHRVQIFPLRIIGWLARASLWVLATRAIFT